MRVFTLAIFLGAFLLFQIQPLIAKYLLPWFGGGPGVWTTCLFFFQTLLVGGYAYAHALTQYFKVRLQVFIHLALLALALACMPIVPAAKWKPASTEHPVAALLFLLTCDVGLPYLALAATGPLLQRWYCRLAPGTSPYPYYGLSNFASLSALLTYPLVFEAHLSRNTQATIWQWAFAVYALACGLCAVFLLRTSRAGSTSRLVHDDQSASEPAQLAARGRSPFQLKLLWLAWPACASILLMATTNKLCLDVAVFPLLWILPLTVYLGSFVLTFAGPRYYPRQLALMAFGAAMAGLGWALFGGATWPLWKQVCVYTGSLFVLCIICHGELFRLRPSPPGLTMFYLLIAMGGALGGLFAAVVAPQIFTNYYELHWGLVLCGFLIVADRTTETIKYLIARPMVLPEQWDKSAAPNPTEKRHSWTGLSMALLWLAFLAMATALWLQARTSNTSILYRSRNFYGVLTVFENRQDEPTGHHFLLRHGRITHGFQFVHPQLQMLPTTYYGSDSGLGLAATALAKDNRRIGVVGLGTGTIAAYAKPGDSFEFYEINPQVIQLATSRFTFLGNCRGRWQITPGDARLILERQPPQNFDLLALDAFNSDSIPVHLLTREAFQEYLRHLKADGILAVHISNHFLNLEPVVVALARDCHLQFAIVDHDSKPEQWWIYSSTWVLLSRVQKVLDHPSIRSATRARSGSTSTLPLWTDDYSSLFQILR